MNNENIEEILKKIGTENVPEDIQKIAQKTSEDFSKQLSKSQKQHNISGVLKYRKLSKLAAAAAIIIAVLFVSHFFKDSISITTPAFSKIIDNALSQKWVYMFEEDRKEGQIKAEYWYNPSTQKLYSKSGDDFAFVLDMVSGDKYEYRSDKITLSKMDDFDVYSGWISERMPMISGLLDKYERLGANIIQKESLYNSQPALLYEIQLTLPEGDSMRTYKYSWLVDKKSHLPIICEHTEKQKMEFVGQYHDSTINSRRYAFDYPDSGPEDIYALGVPSDVNVVDERIKPDSEAKELFDKINSIQETKYNSYAYIVREGDYIRKRTVKAGPNIREELLEIKINGSDYLPKKEEHFEAMGQTFDSVDKWIDNSGIVTRSHIYFCKGQFGYETNDRNIEQKTLMEISLLSGAARERYDRSLINYCWWYSSGGSITKNTYSEQNNLICVEISNRRYYYDPAKEYMCVQGETKEGELTYEIQEFEKTESGILYPSKVSERYLRGVSGSDERTVHYRTIYIYAKDMNDDLRARLDPENLPNFVDHKQLTLDIVAQEAQQDSNDIAYTGFTPLHMAIYRQDIERVKTLLEKGAEVEPEYDTGATPMELAIAAGNLEIVKLLYNHGADFISNDKEERDALGLAVKEGYREIAQFMLDNGSDVDNDYKNQDKPLKYAATEGDLDMVKMLLEYNPEIDSKDTEGRTPLYYAVNSLRNRVAHFTDVEEEFVRRYEDVISLLIEHGADINIRDNQKYTPLLLTITSFSASSKTNEQQLDFLRFLLKNGADPNLSSDSDSTLFRAMESRMYDVARILLEAGVDPWQQITKSNEMQGYYNLLRYSRRIKDDKMYDILYPYMKDRYEQTNKELVELTQQVIMACIVNDTNTIDAICVDHPHYRDSWDKWSGQLRNHYLGKEHLLKNIIPGWFTEGGVAETYIPLPGQTSNKSVLLGFIKYPDGQWKCIYVTEQNDMPAFEQNSGLKYEMTNSLDEFRNLMYENFGQTEKISRSDNGSSTLYGKFSGQLAISVDQGNLRIDFINSNISYILLTPDEIKIYPYNQLKVYTKEFIQKQKEFPEQLIYHPSELIIDTSQIKYIFTVSDGQVLLTQDENKTKAERFVFDLDSWQLQK